GVNNAGWRGGFPAVKKLLSFARDRPAPRPKNPRSPLGRLLDRPPANKTPNPDAPVNDPPPGKNQKTKKKHKKKIFLRVLKFILLKNKTPPQNKK
ncbi:hypothetical protein ACVGXS_12360, partial [Enterobacter hormaechei]